MGRHQRKPYLRSMTTPTNAALHVVLGAGQIGGRLSKLLAAGGHRVRLVSRRPVAVAAGVEHEAGDITDLSRAETLTRGAAVVYDCMNPPYDQWPRSLLPIAKGALHGAARAGARLVALDCLYMYGRPSGPMTEQTPHAPCSKKGELRVRLEALRLSAHRQGDVHVSIGRASDFFGPGLQFSCWSERFFNQLFAGRPGDCLGDPDQLHSYTFADDIARALATLGADPAADGIWHLPTAPALTSRQVTTLLGDAIGRRFEMARLPRWKFAAAAWFSPFMREVREMAYQWEVPFVLDDSKFGARFGQRATPLAESAAVTAKWAVGRLAGRAAAPASTGER
jgi:nucleoside-diphosphate-sugar epimerase